jgi:hypothetical protein
VEYVLQIQMHNTVIFHMQYSNVTLLSLDAVDDRNNIVDCLDTRNLSTE